MGTVILDNHRHGETSSFLYFAFKLRRADCGCCRVNVVIPMLRSAYHTAVVNRLLSLFHAEDHNDHGDHTIRSRHLASIGRLKIRRQQFFPGEKWT